VTGSRKGRFDAFDGVRAFAVLAAFGSHVSQKWASGGWMGVEVFFVLSGYLITSLLLREHRTTGRIAFGRFYARRAVRLYPALLLLLLGGLVCYRDIAGTLPAYRDTALASGLYLEDLAYGFGHPGFFGHTWSLAVEEQFYLFWPPIMIVLLKRKRNIGIIAVVTSFLVLAATGIFLSFGDHTILPGSYFLPWVQAPVLLAGCALAAFEWRPARQWGAAFAAMGALGLVWLTLVNQTSRANDLALMLLGGAAFTVALISGLMADPRSLLARVLGWGPIAYFGRISYGFYLFHYAMLSIVGNRLAARGWSHHRIIAAELLVSFGCAVISYHLLEQPLLKLKRRFEKPVRRPADLVGEAIAEDRPRAPRRPAPPIPRHAAASHMSDMTAPMRALAGPLAPSDGVR
jgi:peptidoglycan/LPS O-acetylase OafA/YrhL